MSFGFAVLCLVCYEAFATPLVSLFIADAATVRYGAVFLRCMVTAMPMMALCYPMIIQFQAMGRARESLVYWTFRCSISWTRSFPCTAVCGCSPSWTPSRWPQPCGFTGPSKGGARRAERPQPGPETGVSKTEL